MSDISSDSEHRVDHRALEDFARRSLEAAGVATAHAERIADALVRADLRGVDTHGLARLETYCKKFESGGFNPDPDISVEEVGDAAVLVDADDGPGQSAGVRAIDEAMDRASRAGIGAAAVTNSNHFGTAAYYTERASEDGYIGMAMTNVGPDVVPFGGTEAFLGTNPVSFSIPTDRSFPITLDMATSMVAMGKIDHAAEAGDPIPDDWAVDEDGEPATHPEDVAALRPMGGPKGYGLSIVVDTLCGVLTGVGTSQTIGALYDDFDEPMRLGHFFMAIDVGAFRGQDAFLTHIGEYIEQLKTQNTRDAVDEIRLPGELEAIAKQQNKRRGITLNEDAEDGIRALVERYDIDLPDGFD